MPYTGRLVIRIEGTVASHCAVSAANVIASHDQIAFIAFDDGLQWNLSYFIGSASIDILGISGAHPGRRQPALINSPVLPVLRLALFRFRHILSALWKKSRVRPRICFNRSRSVP